MLTFCPGNSAPEIPNVLLTFAHRGRSCEAAHGTAVVFTSERGGRSGGLRWRIGLVASLHPFHPDCALVEAQHEGAGSPLTSAAESQSRDTPRDY